MSIAGLITIACRHPVKETMDRLEHDLTDKGIVIFARIDHAGGAASVGLTMRPTELIVFGNPKAGTPLMQVAQTMGIDLPLKILSWEDPDGKTWLFYNSVDWLAARHGIGGISAIAALSETVARIAKTVSS